MKKVLTKFLTFSSVALLMLSSCKKNDKLVTTDGGKPGTLTSNTTNLVLDKTKLDDPTAAITFSFTAPQYTFKASVTNTLQIDAAGDNWKNPVSATLSNKVLVQGYSTAAFNTLLLKMNLPADVASSVNVRIQHALSTTEMTYSNVLALKVTPFNLISFLWVPGDYEGWGNPGPQMDSLVSPNGNGIYTGIINIPAGGTLQFKIVPVKGSWTVAYGDNGGGTLSASGGNITAPSAGQMLVTANLNNNTFSVGPADYYSLIGNDFTGQNWDTDNWMKYINDGSGTWTTTVPMIAPSGGGFKVRQDAQWTFSWGIPQAGTDGAGIANTLNDSKNDNMAISSDGTYNVTFVMPATAYGTTPAVTTTYTLVKQ